MNTTETFDEPALELKIDLLKKHLKTDIRYNLPRPFMIELTGSPGSGKSTTTQVLYDFLRVKGLRVLIPQEGAEVIQHIPRTTPLYNLRTGLYSLSQLIDQGFGDGYDVIIFNRAIFDTYCWMNYWFDKEKLSTDEKSSFQSSFVNRFTAPLIDRAYIMTCEPEVVMQREFRVTISRQTRETTNIKSIENLVRIFKTGYKDLSQTYPQLKYIDTTNMTEQEMVDSIAHDLLSTLAEKIK